jgi:peptidoglycan hydrolase-like protein with peptidoglycan-binding domain
MQRTIAILQLLLAQLGYLTEPFAADVLDAPTREAMNRFQQLHRLSETEAPDEPTWLRLIEANNVGECVVTGEVVDADGPIPNVVVDVRDRDLGPPEQWPPLPPPSLVAVVPRPRTDAAGRFVILYVMDNVVVGDRVVVGRGPVADLVFDLHELPVPSDGFDVRRLPEDAPVADDDRALGIPARRVEEVRLVVRSTQRRVVEGASEFERLLAAFATVWPQTSPASLDDGRREPEFVARELGEPLDRVRALVGAFRVSGGLFDGVVPAQILYGLARGALRLTDVPRLALATSSQLKTAILDAVAQRLIPALTDDVLEQAIRSIRGLTAVRALDEVPAAGGATYREVLRAAVPDETAQTALLQAAAGREADPPAMWAALRAHPAFAEPGAVERAQFALQLDAVTSGHLPLLTALQTEHGVSSARGLLDVDAAALRATVARPDVGTPDGIPGESDAERADAYVTGVLAQVQRAFPTETVAQVVGAAPAEALGGAAVRDGVVAALAAATSDARRAAGTAFDIRTSHVDGYLAEHGDAVLADVAEGGRPAVVGALKRAQRLFRVSTGPEAMDWLLRNDYQSAFRIAEVPRQSFVRDAGAVLGEAQARLLHTRARAAGDATLAAYVQLNDALFGVSPAAVLGEDRVVAGTAIDAAVAKFVPTWHALFHEDAICDCTHCRSVYSPAAYLVDLLHFLELSAPAPGGDAPLDVLLRRRPDIAQLKLTCENTNTEIPYVDLVNEILESLVVSLDQRSIPAFDTEGATAGELRAAPQHTSGDAYVTPDAPSARARLDRAVYPWTLPFDGPLAAARADLRHLGVDRADLMAAFDDGPLPNALAAERLGLDPATFETIAGERLDGAPAVVGASLDERYGWDAASPAVAPPALAPGDAGPFVWTLKRKLAAAGAALTVGDDPAAEPFDAGVEAAVQAFQTARALPVTGRVDDATWAALAGTGPSFASATLAHVPTFLARSALSFAELAQLLGTRFVNPEAPTLEIVRALRLPTAELRAFVAADFAGPDAALLAALAAAHVDEPDFTAWARAHLGGDAAARLARTILVDGPSDASCDLDVLRLRHLDDAAPTLDDGEWLRLDRFVRLWRTLGWPMEDLDLALGALGTGTIDAAALRQLAQIATAARRLALTVPQLVALWAAPDPTRARSLFAERFCGRALLRLDPAFQPDWAGRVLDGATLGDHLSALQAGLRVSGADLAALRAHLGLADDGAALTLDALGALLRVVTLARALTLSVRDLLALLDLGGLQPFVPPADDWVMLRLVRDADAVRQSGLAPSQLALVLGDVAAAAAVPDAARDDLLARLRDGLGAIAADLDAATETDGALTRRALGLLGVEPALVDATLAVLGDGGRSAALLPAPAAPPPAIPAEWAERLTYDASPLAPTLSVLGALTDTERATVAGFSTDAGYVAAVSRLQAAPHTVLADLAAALTALGIEAPAVGSLLADAPVPADAAAHEGVVRARLALLLGAILPSLRARLGRTLVLQTLAPVQPDAATLALLLDGERAPGRPILPALDGARSLLADFLALAAGGDVGAAAQGYELLARLRRLADALGLDADDVATVARRLVALRPTPGRLLTYDDWTAVASYARLRRRPGQPAGALPALLTADSPADARAALARLLGWSGETTADLVGADGLALGTADLARPAAVERVVAAGELVAAAGVTVRQAAAWARLPIDQAAADAARRAVRARYDDAAWLDVAGTLNDPLREARRAALVAYLLPRLGARDANALYGRLLIDVEMSPAMTTSRIRQAIASTQLFVQRCLLNVDPDVPAGSIDHEHWQWMQNYRLWEANRKVLLYPENWILPELRDDKTPFFRELESDLLQNDVNDTNVERALESYLEKLDEVAKLDIVAMHVQEGFEPDEHLRTVVHVFGRSPNPPHALHYRRYVVTHNGTALWTPWEPTPVAVQGRLVAPVVFNRRLYLFWATAVTKAKPEEPPRAYYQEVQLSWAEYRDGVWSPTRVTDAEQVVVADYDPSRPRGTTVEGEPAPLGVVERLEAQVVGDELRLLCIESRDFISGDATKSANGPRGIIVDGVEVGTPRDGNESGTRLAGAFVLGGCHAQVVVEPLAGYNRLAGVVMQFKDGTLQAKPLSAAPPAPPNVPVLGAIPDRTRLVEAEWVHPDGGYFVLDDERRTFLAQTSVSAVSPQAALANPERAYPHRATAEATAQATTAAAATAATRSSLTATLTRVEGVGHPWSTASASLASVGLASLAAAEAAVVPADGAASLHDAATTHAVISEVVGGRLALGRPTVRVRFEPLFHPFVCSYVKALRQSGVDGLLTLGNQQLRLTPEFIVRYHPDATIAPPPYPTSGVDFGGTETPGAYRASAYAVYNWELFFHVPMLVADRLMQSQRFEDARRWMHHVFDPTDGTGGYWKVAPFQSTPAQSTAEWLARLGAGDPELQRQVAEWKDHPFEPHRIARMRVTSYKKYVVMKYLDLLVAWGDALFGRDTAESIAAATQLYVMAAELLGPSLERLPSRGEPAALTFAEMRGRLDALSDAAAEYENAVPFLSGASLAPAAGTVGLLGMSRSLYFCLPPNDKLLAYWDTVADRLFKVRHSMSLAGVVRRLALFDPPIDPALLVAAVAQGRDLGSVLGDLGAPLPHHRFRFTIQRATEACADVRALGAQLLAALEKKDAEELALLRATHETTLRATLRETRRQQELEAQAQVEGLLGARAVPVERLRHLRGLMGVDTPAPAVGADIPMVAYDPTPGEAGGVFLIDEERQELDASHSARDWQVIASTTEILASLSHYIPTLEIPIGAVVKAQFGGVHVGPGLSAIARYQSTLGAEDTYDAAHAAKMATFKRRQQDVAHQANVAAREIMHLDRQITAATLHAAVAGLERAHLETEIAQAELVERHYRGKYTNAQLYGWMRGQITSLYVQSYQLALELAKRAERCHRFERGLTSTNYVRAGGWDDLHQGLGAGEALQLQLRQLERAHHDQDRRELEITKHVSLRQHAPLALLRLKATGRAEFELPELLFDMDHPGHFMRRVRSASVTIPAVVGPYTALNATLTLLTNETRVTGALRGGRYERDVEADDERFVSDFAPIQAIVTSTGQNDGGLFESSYGEDRYLPFEGAGAASRWRVELDPDCNRFDLETVSDVVLQLRYTARDGGEQLAQKAKDRWKQAVADAESAPLSRLFSLKQEFPGEWHRLRTVAEPNGDHVRAIALTRDRFPTLFARRELHVGRIDVFGVPVAGTRPTSTPAVRQPDATAVALTVAAPLGPLLHRTAAVDVRVGEAEADALWQLSVAQSDVAGSVDLLDDLLLLCHYDVRPAAG